LCVGWPISAQAQWLAVSKKLKNWEKVSQKRLKIGWVFLSGLFFCVPHLLRTLNLQQNLKTVFGCIARIGKGERLSRPGNAGFKKKSFLKII